MHAQDKQTNAREAYRQIISSQSNVITVPNRTEKKNMIKKVRHNIKRPVVKTIKPHKIRITLVELRTAGSKNYRGLKALLVSTNLHPWSRENTENVRLP